MPSSSGDRSAYFPRIEAKHGKPVAFFLQQLDELGDATYAEQMALLSQRYGFSRTHANALVMYARGSTSARRFGTVEEYLAGLPAPQQRTVRSIIDTVGARHPDGEWLVAWNQPMFRVRGHYVFGISAAAHHLLIAPWGQAALRELAPRLAGYKVNKKTIQVPEDWEVDADLIGDLIAVRLTEID